MRQKKYIFAILGALVVLNIFAWSVVRNLDKNNLEVIFFNVGQGDSAFVQTPQGYQILIDGGPDSTILEKLGEAMPIGDRTIDLIILSHPDHDHIAGLMEVLKSYKVSSILWTGVIVDTAEFREWQRLIQEESSNIYIATANQRITAGSVYLNVMYPFTSLAGQTVKNANDTSVVLQLSHKGNSVLFTGDISQSIEEQLVKDLKIDSDILKVAHHGSKTSSSDDFIAAVSPQIAVISSGKDNSYGHPHQETLDTLEKYDISILRTDLNGDVTINLNY